MRKSLLLILLFVSFSWVGASLAQEVPPPESGPQEELIAEEAQQQNWMQAFQQAESVFNSINQTDSIPLFQDLITKMTEEKGKRALTEPERLLLAKSLDYLGQAFYNEGQQDEAGSVFLKLIEAEPNYQLNADLVSSKIITFVDELRKENLGAMNITSVPPDAEIIIDGKPVGKTDAQGIYSLKGVHNVEVKKPGFTPQTETVTITAGRTESLSFVLERSSSVAYFITYPKGVEIFVNGKRVGITGGDPAERAQQASTEQNLPIDDFSDEFPVAELQPGTYEVEFRKPCWETPPRRVTIETNDDHFFSPIVLVPSKGVLNIAATDAQAGIFIDEEYKGVGPTQSVEVCSGKHVVKVKGVMGKFRQEVEVRKDQKLDIKATLNPAVAFLGILGGENTAQQTFQQLSGVKTLNFENHSGEPQPHADAMREIISSMQSNRPDESRKARINDLCNKLETDLLMMGQTLDGGRVRYYLFSNWSSMPDIRELQPANEADWNTFRAQLDYEEPPFGKRTGASYIDTLLTPGPVITRLSLKTYDEGQPLMVGDVVSNVDGKNVQTAAQLHALFHQSDASDNITVNVVRNNTPTAIKIRMVRVPMEVDYTDPRLLFNRQMANYKRFFHTASTPLEKNMALLNLGLCHMHFGEYNEAVEQFRQIQMERQTGIGPGTVRYRMAQCYREMGFIREAVASLAEAQRYPQNTVRSDDGWPLPREIERLQKSLR